LLGIALVDRLEVVEVNILAGECAVSRELLLVARTRELLSGEFVAGWELLLVLVGTSGECVASRELLLAAGPRELGSGE
jgi:hypothetical protein